MTIQNKIHVALACLLAASLTGCSGEPGIPTLPVSGTVLYKNKPAEGAIVSFNSVGGPPASGVTDAAGVYKLSTKVSGDGALAGTYQVSIAMYAKTVSEEVDTKPDLEDVMDITNEYAPDYNEMEEGEKAAAISKNLLPIKYANPRTSGLTANVAEDGQNTFDFTLE